MTEFTDKEFECFDYLERLRQSGVTNMYGASPYLERRFKMKYKDASDILVKWMENYDYLRTTRNWSEKDMSLTYEDIRKSIPIIIEDLGDYE